MHQISEVDESRSRRITPIPKLRDVQKSVLLGLVNRKQRWGLSWKGWILFFLVIVGVATAAFYRVYPFLAVTQRADTGTLVVEGWIHEYAIRAAINEFHSGNYERIFTTGGPIEGMGGFIDDAHTSANLARKRLLDEGVAPDRIQMAPLRTSVRDRTYSAAQALRDWLQERHVTVQSVNVVTEDVHARRSRLLFQEALGPGVKVGIIAVPNPDYDVRQWYRYSEGVRQVISESVAYVYAKFLFWPSTAGPQRD